MTEPANDAVVMTEPANDAVVMTEPVNVTTVTETCKLELDRYFIDFVVNITVTEGIVKTRTGTERTGLKMLL